MGLILTRCFIHYSAQGRVRNEKNVDVRSRNFPENPDADQILVIREADYLREAQDQDDTLKHIKKNRRWVVPKR
jgi:hypothetical protein